MTKKIVPIAIAVLMLIVAGFSAFFFMQNNRYHEVTWCSAVTVSDGVLYSIDSQGTNWYIISQDMTTGESEMITVSYTGTETSQWVYCPFADDAGNLYVYYEIEQFHSDSIETITTFQICLCNFDTGKLEPVYEFDTSQITSLVYATATADGRMLCLVGENNGLSQYEFDGSDITLVGQTTWTDETLCLFYADQSGNLWGQNVTGDLYFTDFTSDLSLAFANDGSVISIENSSPLSVGDALVFTNYDTNATYQLYQQDGSFVLEEQQQGNVLDSVTEDVTWDDDIDGTDIYYGTLTNEQNKTVAAVFDGELYTLDTVTLSWSSMFGVGLRSFFGTLLVELLLLAAILVHRKRSRGLSIFMLFLCVAIPGVIYLAFVTLPKMETVIMEGKTLEAYQQLEQLAETCQATVSVESILENQEKETLTYEDIAANLGTVYLSNYVWNEGTDSYEKVSFLECYSALYTVEDGQVYSACDSYVVNVPLDSYVNSNVYGKTLLVYEQGELQYAEYVEASTHWICVLAPVTDDDGTIIAVLQLQFDADNVYSSIINEVVAIKWLYYVAITVLVLLVCIVLMFSTKDLSKVAQVAEKISDGDLSARTNLKNGTEIAQLGRTLNRMAADLEARRAQLQLQGESYQSFFQHDLFKQLHQEGIVTAKVMDSIHVANAALYINIPSTDTDIHRRINRQYAPQISYLTDHRVGDFLIFSDNLQVICTNNTNAVDHALRLLQLRAMTGEDCYTAVAKQTLKFGIVGTQQRKAVARISLDHIFAVKLLGIATQYQIPLVVSGEGSSLIDNFTSRYHLRVLGYMRVAYADKLEILYEVLDGNAQNQMRLKMDTRVLFEDGVDLFMVKNKSLAMKKFIQVLRRNPDDLVAKQYILLCQEQQENDNDVFLAEI